MSDHKQSPAVQVRLFLTVGKRQGIAFDEAWTWALARCRWNHDTALRREWKEILDEMKPIFASAYENGEMPAGARAMIALADALRDADDEHAANPVRVPPNPHYRAQTPGRREALALARRQRDHERRRKKRAA